MSHLYESVARHLSEGIDSGVYRAGDRLPGVRRMAQQQGVSVATAVAAYQQLEAAGRIEARPRSGYYVRPRNDPGFEAPKASTPDAEPTLVSGQELVLRLVQATNDPAIVQLGAAVPDPGFLPTGAVERALARVGREQRQRCAGYEFPPGAPELRLQIARRMAQVGCNVPPEEIVVTNGCQEALTLALRAVTEPGDVVAIESPSFYGLLQVIDSLGLKALEIPTHPEEGISLAALQLALEQWPVRACVTVPNYSNPLGFCMPDPQRRALVALLVRHGIPLIEDDVYGDLGFSPQRPAALKSHDGNVIYCASFSKTLSPGLRIGWVAPGRRWLEQVEYLKYVTNLAAPTQAQLAVADFLARGGYERYLRRARGEYARAVARMSEAVVRHFPPGTRISRPRGGFVIWLELPGEVDTVQLANRALAAGISIAPGPIFSASGKYRNCMRLSCAAPWGPPLERALARLAQLL